MKTYQVPGTGTEIYGKLKSKIQQLQQSGKLSYVQNLEFSDASQEIQAKGTGYTAKLIAADGKIDVNLDLSLLMKPMRGTIEGQLESMVQKIFA